MFDLTKHHLAAEAHKPKDATVDYWQFDVFDQRYSFDDYPKRLAA